MPGLEEAGVAELLAEHGLNATPGAVELVARESPSEELLERLAGELSSPVVTREHVREILETERNRANDTEDGGGTAVNESQGTGGPADRIEPERRGQENRQSSVSVYNDVTGDSTCTGVYEDFVGLFRDRFEHLSGLLRQRLNPRTIGSLGDASGAVSLVGVVNDVRPTSNGNRLLELEDTTGRMRVVASGDLLSTVEAVVTDEVIGVEGRLSDDGGVVFADQIHFPDVPPRREPRSASRSVKAALVSDLHVGSKAFTREKWAAFTEWLAGADDVEYVLICGDLVEGVGVYPGQEDELTIVDINEQYRECAERLSMIPGDKEVVAITGNHDSVRLAEPQPALPEEFRDGFPGNVRFVGNPSTVDLEGVRVLMYHGTSLNAFVEEVPGVSVEEPTSGMRHQLRKRHLAPMYGRVRLAPERRDYLVIEDVPDVLHSGHLHTVGVDRYNGVTMVNTGAWQTQTEYQKAVNIEPDVGYAAILELDTLDVTLRRF